MTDFSRTPPAPPRRGGQNGSKNLDWVKNVPDGTWQLAKTGGKIIKIPKSIFTLSACPEIPRNGWTQNGTHSRPPKNGSLWYPHFDRFGGNNGSKIRSKIDPKMQENEVQKGPKRAPTNHNLDTILVQKGVPKLSKKLQKCQKNNPKADRKLFPTNDNSSRKKGPTFQNPPTFGRVRPRYPPVFKPPSLMKGNCYETVRRAP